MMTSIINTQKVERKRKREREKGRETKCRARVSVRPKTIKFNYSCKFLHFAIVLWSFARWMCVLSRWCVRRPLYKNTLPNHKKNGQKRVNDVTLEYWVAMGRYSHYPLVGSLHESRMCVYRIKKFSPLLHNSIVFAIRLLFLSFALRLKLVVGNFLTFFSIHSSPYSISVAQSVFRLCLNICSGLRGQF